MLELEVHTGAGRDILGASEGAELKLGIPLEDSTLGTWKDVDMSVRPLAGECHFRVSSKAERYCILFLTLKPAFTINFLLKNALGSQRFPRWLPKLSCEVSEY